MSNNFGGKIGVVRHHLLDATGNVGHEQPFIEIHNDPGYQELVSYDKDYYEQSVSEGWPYINITQSDNTHKLHVKVYADWGAKVRKYEWNWGDHSPIEKTINRETEHVYNLDQTSWLDQSGNLPIRGLELYTGRWTDVSLKMTDLSNDATTTTKRAFVYKIDSTGLDNYWQLIDAVPNSGGAEVIQAQVINNDQVQMVNY